MPQRYEVPNYGVFDFPDDMSEEEIFYDIDNNLVPSLDANNPDPAQVSARPDLFPDIDRGSFWGGLETDAEGIGRIPEAVGAAYGRSPEDLAAIKAQTAEQGEKHKYDVTLEGLGDRWDNGDKMGAAWDFVTDYVPKIAGESAIEMGVGMGAGAGAAAGLAALATAPISAPVAIGAAIAGTAVALWPTMFRSNVERQIEAKGITDPNEIESFKASAVALAQSASEGLLAPILRLVPGASGLGRDAVSALLRSGAQKLTTKKGLAEVTRSMILAGVEEPVAEIGQQMMERWQAGLEVTNPEAFEEYKEAAIGALVLGSGMAGGISPIQQMQLNKAIKEGRNDLEMDAALGNYFFDAQNDAAAENQMFDEDVRQEGERNAQGFTLNETGDEQTIMMNEDGTPILDEAGNVQPIMTLPAPERDTDIDSPSFKARDVEGDVTQMDTDQGRQARIEAIKRSEAAAISKANRRREETATAKSNATEARREAQAKLKPKEGWDILDVEENPMEEQTYTIAELEEISPAAAAIMKKDKSLTPDTPIGENAILEKVSRSKAAVSGLKETLHQHHMNRAEDITHDDRNIQSPDIVELAKSKNIKTEGSAFDALVNYVSDAKNLKDATAYEKYVIKSALEKFAVADKPYDPIPTRDANYSESHYNTVANKLNEQVEAAKGKNLASIKASQGTISDIISKAGLETLDKKAIKELQSDLVKDRIIWQEKGKGKAFRPDRVAPTVKDGKNTFLDKLQKDEQTDPWVPAETKPAPEGGFYVKETNGTFAVMAAQPNVQPGSNASPEMVKNRGLDEVISRGHETQGEAEAAMAAYEAAPTSASSTDLRGVMPDPAAYRAKVAADLVRNTPPAPAVSEKTEAALNDTTERRGLGKLGIPLRIVQSIGRTAGGEVEGSYDNDKKLIHLAVSAAETYVDNENVPAHMREQEVEDYLQRVLSHEQIHALKAAGVISDTDYNLLSRMATTKARPENFAIDKTQGPKWTYMEDVKKSQPGLGPETKAASLKKGRTEAEATADAEAAYAEEAIAELFRDWAQDKSVVAGKPASIFRKIIKFFTSLGGWLNEKGVRSVGDVFSEIDSGAMVEQYGNKTDNAAGQGTGPHGDMIDGAPVKHSVTGFGERDGDAYFAGEYVEDALEDTTDPRSRRTLVYMTPDEYKKMAEHGYKGDSDAVTFDLLKAGKKFNALPQLTIDHDGNGTAYVISHDGRHRTNNLRILGKVQQVPVILISSNAAEKGGREIRWGQQGDPDHRDFVETMPTRLVGQGQNAKNEMDIPVSVIWGEGGPKLSVAASEQVKAIEIPAVKWKGKVYRGVPGQFHANIISNIPGMAVEEKIGAALGFGEARPTEGFILTRDYGGKFVDREEAYYLAKAAGQLVKDPEYHSDLLSNNVKYSVAPGEPKAIERPAMRYKGKIYRGDPGGRHFAVWQKHRDKLPSEEDGGSFAEGLERGYILTRDYGGGFVTREQAYPLAKAAGQLYSDAINYNLPGLEGLVSEDLKYSVAPQKARQVYADHGSVGPMEQRYPTITAAIAAYEDGDTAALKLAEKTPEYQDYVKEIRRVLHDSFGPRLRVISDRGTIKEMQVKNVAFIGDGLASHIIEKDRGRRQSWRLQLSAFTRPANPMRRYTSLVRRVGKKTLPRSFFASSDVEARALAAQSPNMNRGAFEVGVPYLDDPHFESDMAAPKYSIRRNLRDMKKEERENALAFVPVHENLQVKGYEEVVRGVAWMTPTEPLPIVLLNGTDKNGVGFGREHILAKSERFGGSLDMAKVLQKFMTATQDSDKRDQFTITRYKNPNIDYQSKNDYRMRWTDPASGQEYALGIEKWKRDGTTYAAVTTFFPMDDAKAASKAEIQDYVSRRAPRDHGRVQRRGRAGNVPNPIDGLNVAASKFSVAPSGNALLDYIKAHPEGFTVSVDGGFVPPSGFAFAPIKGAEIKVALEDLSEDHVDQLTDYIARLQEVSPTTVYAGGWLNPADGVYYLDASTVLDDIEQALYIADAAEQIAIFDLGEFNEINTAEGIARLKETGAYSSEAHDVSRRNQEELVGQFGPARDQGENEQVKFSVAGQQLLRNDPAGLGLSPEMVGRVNPIYRPEVLPIDRMKGGNREAAQWLENHYTGTVIDDMVAELTPEQLHEVGNLMAAEVQLGLEGSDHAFDWYSEALERAIDVAKQKFPMLASDAAAADAGFGTASNARFAFTYIMAVTSQNLAVVDNAKATIKAFDAMVKRVGNGKYAMLGSWATGDKRKAMAKNFAKFGPMIKAMPGNTFPDQLAALDILFRESRTVKDWVSEMKARKIPYTTPGQTAINAVVYGSSVLGPKIGNGFWQNLNHNFSPLTIDLWMRRTWGRLTGKSIGNPGALPAQRARFKAAIIRSRSRAQGNQDHIDAARANVRLQEWYLEQIEKGGAKDFPTKKAYDEEVKRLKSELANAQEVAADIQGIKAPKPWRPEYNTDDAALLKYAKEAERVWKKEYDRLVAISNSGEVPAELQPTWARAAKTIITNLAKPLDQVANGTQRIQIEKAGEIALEILASRGINMTTADMQAMLWYPEKELWGALKFKLNTDENGNPVVPPSELNESYDTAFARILGEQAYEDQGTTGNRSGGDGAGAVTGQAGRSQRSESVDRVGSDGSRDTGPASGAKLSVAPRFNQPTPGAPSLEQQYNEFTERDKTIWSRVKKQVQRQVAPGGLLPKFADGVVIEGATSLHELKMGRDGRFTVDDLKVQNNLTAYERAAKTGYNKRYSQLTDAEKKQIDDAIHGGPSLGNIPDAMKEVVAHMRQHIDGLSGRYIDIINAQIADYEAEANRLRASGDNRAAAHAEHLMARAEFLRDVIVDNKGEYVTRSYKTFDDPMWFKKIPQDVYANAYNYLMRQYNGDQTTVNRVIDELTKGMDKAYTSVEAMVKESTLGAKDLGILKARKDIAPEIRALMGEYTDPSHNYARTILKMTRLIWNTHFLDGMKQGGMGVFLFEPNDPNRPRDVTHTIAGEKSDVLSPLNGLMVTPEVAQALQDALGKSTAGPIMSTIFGINGLVKAGKILYSPPTQIRNVVSATFFAVMSGGIHFSKIGPALKIISNEIKENGGDPAKAFQHYVRINLVHDTPNAGLVQDLMKDGEGLLHTLEYMADTNLDPKKVEPVSHFLKKSHRMISNLYRAGDDIWKIIIFESQLQDYMKAKPGVPRAEAERIVAKRVRNTVPSYSQTGYGMKNLSRFPLIGPFVAFSSEIIRTNINNIKLIKADLADPDLRPMAYKRIVGTVIAHSWAKAAMVASAAAMGMDDDEEEALRKVGLGPWARNSDLLFMGRDKDNRLVAVDLSFVDPYNMFHKAVTAITRNQPWEDSAVGALGELFGPFIQPDIAVSGLAEVLMNKRLRSGAPIFNPDAPASEQATDIAIHLGKQWGPGIFNPLGKMFKAVDGQRDPTGRVYNLGTEALGMVGWKTTTFDPKFSLYFRTFEFREQLGRASGYLKRVAGDTDQVDPDELQDAYTNANEMRERAYDDMAQIVNAAKKSGLSDQQVRQVLRTSGISKKYSNALARGQDAPSWKLGRTFLRGNIKRAGILYDRETARTLKDRRRAVRQMERLSR